MKGCGEGVGFDVVQYVIGSGLLGGGGGQLWVWPISGVYFYSILRGLLHVKRCVAPVRWRGLLNHVYVRCCTHKSSVVC